MATSSSQPKYSDIPKHYTPIPAAQDESSWRTYINGRKGKGRAAKQDQADMIVEVEPSDAINTGVAIVDHAHSTAVNGTQHGARDAINDLLETSAAVADASKPPAPASIVWTDPRPPIPTLMRSLDHVSRTVLAIGVLTGNMLTHCALSQYTIISLLEHFDGWLRDRLEDISSPLKPSTVFLPPSMQRKKRKPTQVNTAVVSATPTSAMTEPVEPVIPTTPLVLTPLDSQWLFSLLTVLDPLLSSEDISTLRGLARTCREIADFTWDEQQKWSAKGAVEVELAKYKESIGGCWMVNAAIWEIWGQRDLWD